MQICDGIRRCALRNLHGKDLTDFLFRCHSDTNAHILCT